ncbi:MAG: sodium:phosphate symporter [Alphaproteobacteria bacterium]|nr:sodium:phosphate symporter [Alphaproteobacteria bacterium]
MTVDTQQIEPPTAGKSGLVDRVKRILLEPKAEWARIDVEQTSVGAIFRNWVLILAAIPALADLVGSLAFGHSFFGITYRPSPMQAVASAIVRYVLSVAGIFLLALLIDALAPQFGGTRSRLQAVKVAAYSATAAWIAGIFGLIPSLAVLGIVGLYSLYLLYLGLPRLMKVAEDKAAAYTAVTVIAALVLALVVGLVVAPVTLMIAGGAGPVATTPAGTVTVPGAGTLDLGKLQEVSTQVQSGKPQAALAPASLQALLPASLGAYKRTELSSAGANAGGLGGSEAEARYENGDSHIRLQVTDMAVAGAIAALGSALNVESSSQTANGYEKSGNVDGRMTTEKWNNASHDGSYGVVVASRFMVEAEGKVASVDALKQAVNAVGIDRLEALAAKH